MGASLATKIFTPAILPQEKKHEPHCVSERAFAMAGDVGSEEILAENQWRAEKELKPGATNKCPPIIKRGECCE